MKLPSEAELIEMENRTASLIARSEKSLCAIDPFGEWVDRFDQFRADFRLLISLARDPSELLRSIPDDQYLNLYDARVRRAIAPVTPQKARPAKKKRKKS
jgi:hypothetical protein